MADTPDPEPPVAGDLPGQTGNKAGQHPASPPQIQDIPLHKVAFGILALVEGYEDALAASTPAMWKPHTKEQIREGELYDRLAKTLGIVATAASSLTEIKLRDFLNRAYRGHDVYDEFDLVMERMGQMSWTRLGEARVAPFDFDPQELTDAFIEYYRLGADIQQPGAAVAPNNELQEKESGGNSPSGEEGENGMPQATAQRQPQSIREMTQPKKPMMIAARKTHKGRFEPHPDAIKADQLTDIEGYLQKNGDEPDFGKLMLWDALIHPNDLKERDRIKGFSATGRSFETMGGRNVPYAMTITNQPGQTGQQ